MQWKEKGILKTEDQPAVYIYEEEFDAYGKREKVKGMICRVQIEDFSKGVILPQDVYKRQGEDSSDCNFAQIYIWNVIQCAQNQRL